MAKDKTILITFSEDLLGDITSANNTAFTITGTRYKYVGGPVIPVTYPAINVRRPRPPQGGKAYDTTAAFEDGVSTDTEVSMATLTLKEASS
jgi:hypothetical protein